MTQIDEVNLCIVNAFVEIRKIGVFGYRFIKGSTFQPLADQFHQGGLSYTDVARNCNVLFHIRLKGNSLIKKL